MRSILKGLFLPALLILTLQVAASRVLSVQERDLPLPNLRALPTSVGEWGASGEQSLDANITAYLKPDDYIIRNYSNKSADSTVAVFVAYFKSLQNVYGPHSPRLCLPGSGWLVRSSKIKTVNVPGRSEAIPVNEYLLEKGDDRILMIYWYQNNRNVWAEEFQAKLTMLPDLLRYRRSDASLVRLITPLKSSDGSPELSQTLQFTKLIFPMLVERFQATN